ncbi:hypothetical protein RHMOL_Rhmol03G0178700 [Rhododendron molle]|uniref:Uncharacterized protein n=1 Tax=Rhododendron molle TaxID=49168 RepID=A0ACC0PG29_RHOML|nr:hypothetical protein RHMOL_Rhmol03G0178700 [Rhododendron molle]
MDVHFQGTYRIDLSSRLSFPHPMGQCWTNLCGCKSETDSEQNSQVQLASGNVHLITSTQGWEDKISESSRDRKIEFSTSWDIKATPTFFFLKDGRQIDKLVGANKQELQRKISTIADSTNRAK